MTVPTRFEPIMQPATHPLLRQSIFSLFLLRSPPVTDLSDSSDLPVNRGPDRAGVIAAPPILFGSALILGLSLQAMRPAHLSAVPSDALRVTGISLILIGLMLSAAVMRAFRHAGTHVSPYRATTRFVGTGPYRYTRNPDYIGQTLMYGGIALVANSWWPLLLLPPALLVIQHGVVRREERYLEGKFGQEYRDYVARVPRWLTWRSRSSDSGHAG